MARNLAGDPDRLQGGTADVSHCFLGTGHWRQAREALDQAPSSLGLWILWGYAGGGGWLQEARPCW